MTVVGFDFGTTNSLVSVIRGNAPINLLDPDRDQPFPSIVAYEGADVVVGEAAKQRLGTAGLGVHGNIVRSPKVYLGREDLHVGGQLRSPEDIVADVVSHVRDESVAAALDAQLGLDAISRAVVTMPVQMSGDQRRQLRSAFARCGVDVVQFVHEPFAALYGYLRSQPDPEDVLRQLDRKLVLVVDWGGGTLDLTLCRVRGRSLTQLVNLGINDVGGDYFDEAIQRFVIGEFMSSRETSRVDPDAELRLLHQCETAKIMLSDTDSYALYVPGFLAEGGESLSHRLDRTQVEHATSSLVSRGLDVIEKLLADAEIGPLQVGMCLATGGMVNMPVVRSQLHQLFGSQRVVTSSSTQTLVAEGAAWVAHDRQTLVLARPVELLLARHGVLPLVKAGTPSPRLDEVVTTSHSLYCADPRDGRAHFQLVTPERAGAEVQNSDPRRSLDELWVDVDSQARPLMERIELDVILDHDLVLTATATSTIAGDSDRVSLNELEFGLELPRGDVGRGVSGLDDHPFDLPLAESRPGELVVRANITAAADDWHTVPGEVLACHRPADFERGRQRATQVQVDERLYYQPCANCGRRSNHPDCRCAQRLGWLLR